MPTQGAALGYERVGPSGRFDKVLHSRLKLLCNLRNPRLKPLKLINLKTKTMNKEKWKFVIQTVIAILTAIATSLGVTSCIC
jgi:hypothetical protein